jgi:autotransporter-associated beta strand protein
MICSTSRLLGVSLVLSLAVVWAVLCPGRAQADIRDWTGGTNTSWDTPSNWNPAAVAGASDIARWDANSYARPLDTGGADRTIGQFLFTADNTGGATIGGNCIVSISGVSDGSKYIGILVANGSGAVTVGKPLALTNAQSWINNSSKPLKISDYWKIDADLTIEGSGTGGVNFSGLYETAGGGGSGGLIVNLPNGVVTIRDGLQGRFAGQTIVRQGILSVGSINDYNTNGTLGYNAWPVILGDNGTTGTLKYTGPMVSRNRGFTLAGGGAFQVDLAESFLTITGPIDGAGGLTKTGAGVLILSGANTYTGDTIVLAGTLSIGNGSNGSSNLADASTVKISVDAEMNLNFSGYDQIADLWLGGVHVPAGTYDRGIGTPIDYRSYFTGAGSLLVVPDVLSGDADGDGVVTAVDFITLKKNLGQDTTLGAEEGDFNGDKQVNWADLQLLAGNMGPGGSGATAAPEPCSAMLLVFGALAVLGRLPQIGKLSTIGKSVGGRGN